MVCCTIVGNYKKAFKSYSYSFILVEAILKENLHLQLKLQVAK